MYGFLYDGSTWQTLIAPGARNTYVYGISGDNMAGYFEDSTGENHGFFYDGTKWTILDAPGATSTYAHDVDGDLVVGRFYDGSDYHGFIYDGTDWTILDPPGGRYTRAFGIDGNHIVGITGSTGVSFVYTIPEPCTILLFALGGLALRFK